MASSGPNSPATITTSDVDGNLDWTNPSNVTSSNNSYADTSGYSTGGTIGWNKVRLLVAGSETGSNKSDGETLSASDTYKSFGGASDTWSASPSVSQVNASNFGVRIQLTDGGVDWGTTYYLDCTNFGFSLPSATVDGILVEIENKATGGIAYLDHVRMTVYYTEIVATGHPAIRRFSQCRGFRPVGIGSEGVTIG